MSQRTRRAYLARHQRDRGPWRVVRKGGRFFLPRYVRYLVHLPQDDAAEIQRQADAFVGPHQPAWPMEVGVIEGFRFITSPILPSGNVASAAK